METTSTSSDSGIRDLRLSKIKALKDKGVNPYPVKATRTAFAGELHKEFGHLQAEDTTGIVHTVTGRIVLKREMGKLAFATLRDSSGSIQLFVLAGELGDSFKEFCDLDLGDWVSATGEVISSKKGELSIKVSSFELLSKCLRPLPDKFKGMTDQDQIYRQRELDLIMNEESRRRFEIRHAAIASIRKTFIERGYVEVEGPTLHLQPGGATAKPFITHHNALDQDLYLRIAEELHLKRLVVGGMERVFEIGRVYRNEGISTRHNPEFTMLESYEAFADYFDIMDLTETLISNAATDAIGRTDVEFGGNTISLAGPYRRASMIELVEEAIGEKLHPSMDLEEARAIAKRNNIEVKDYWGVGKIIGELYEEHVEKDLIQPTFVMDYPQEISPLARQHRDDPELTERFELVVGGRELANAFSELNDPVEQRIRFEEEKALAEAGDDEAAHTIDEEYIRALEYGLPPTGGLGIGMDRLAMLLAETTTIRDIVLFPTLRPEV